MPALTYADFTIPTTKTEASAGDTILVLANGGDKSYHSTMTSYGGWTPWLSGIEYSPNPTFADGKCSFNATIAGTITIEKATYIPSPY